MQGYEGIAQVLELAIRLENLCEGFDETNKSAVLTSKIKILFELSKKEFVSPSELKNNVGLAKSNIAIFCNALVKDGYVEKKKDKFDTREIMYCLTESGKVYLKEYLSLAKRNFERQLAYKDNAEQIKEAVEALYQLIK